VPGERPDTGANLQHAAARRKVRHIDDRFETMAIKQEVLPEAFVRPDAVPPQKIAPVRFSHASHRCPPGPTAGLGTGGFVGFGGPGAGGERRHKLAHHLLIRRKHVGTAIVPPADQNGLGNTLEDEVLTVQIGQ